MPRMNEGRLDLTASKKHYTFSSLKAVHITPGAQVRSNETLLRLRLLMTLSCLLLRLDLHDCCHCFEKEGPLLTSQCLQALAVTIFILHWLLCLQMLPDVLVTSLAVCGRLSSGDARFKVSSRRVSLTSIGGASEPVAEQVSTDADGSFCFMVPPGR